MGQFYEVQFAKRTDYQDQHGNVTDSVKFTTEGNSVLWTHKPETQINPGMKAYGRIEERQSAKGNTYYKFVREQQDQGFTPSSPTASTSQQGYGKQSNNSDGMRQGMCINNAAAFIAALVRAGIYSTSDPTLWAADVKSYAKELYKIDLTQEEVPTITEEDLKKVDNGTLLDDVAQYFPGAQAVPANG